VNKTDYYAKLEKLLLWLGLKLLVKEEPGSHAAAFLEFMDHGEYGLAFDELEALLAQHEHPSSDIKAMLEECRSLMSSRDADA
jgi:hypothetical protein